MNSTGNWQKNSCTWSPFEISENSKNSLSVVCSGGWRLLGLFGSLETTLYFPMQLLMATNWLKMRLFYYGLGFIIWRRTSLCILISGRVTFDRIFCSSRVTLLVLIYMYSLHILVPYQTVLSAFRNQLYGLLFCNSTSGTFYSIYIYLSLQTKKKKTASFGGYLWETKNTKTSLQQNSTP